MADRGPTCDVLRQQGGWMEGNCEVAEESKWETSRLVSQTVFPGLGPFQRSVTCASCAWIHRRGREKRWKGGKSDQVPGRRNPSLHMHVCGGRRERVESRDGASLNQVFPTWHSSTLASFPSCVNGLKRCGTGESHARCQAPKSTKGKLARSCKRRPLFPVLAFDLQWLIV